MNIEILKRIMPEKKARLPSLRNQDWKTVKVEIEKINKILTHISTNNITELNELIYEEAKLVCDKIGARLKNTNRNSKPGWEIRLETQIRNLQQGQMMRHRKNAGIFWDEKEKATQVKQTIQPEEINQKMLAKEGRLKRYCDRIEQYRKKGHSKTTNKNSIC